MFLSGKIVLLEKPGRNIHVPVHQATGGSPNVALCSHLRLLHFKQAGGMPKA